MILLFTPKFQFLSAPYDKMAYILYNEKSQNLPTENDLQFGRFWPIQFYRPVLTSQNWTIEMLSLVAPTNLFLGRGARKVEFFRVDVVSGSSYQLFWVGEPKNVEFFCGQTTNTLEILR